MDKTILYLYSDYLLLRVSGPEWLQYVFKEAHIHASKQPASCFLKRKETANFRYAQKNENRLCENKPVNIKVISIERKVRRQDETAHRNIYTKCYRCVNIEETFHYFLKRGTTR